MQRCQALLDKYCSLPHYPLNSYHLFIQKSALHLAHYQNSITFLERPFFLKADNFLIFAFFCLCVAILRTCRADIGQKSPRKNIF